jgi:hypothetical protein
VKCLLREKATKINKYLVLTSQIRADEIAYRCRQFAHSKIYQERFTAAAQKQFEQLQHATL